MSIVLTSPVLEPPTSAMHDCTITCGVRTCQACLASAIGRFAWLPSQFAKPFGCFFCERGA